MTFVIVGLGNPGKEYTHTRHNIGADALEYIRMSGDFSEWKEDTKKEALVSTGTIADKEITLVFPQTYMNLSGRAVKKFVPYQKDVENLLVIQDELDLPLGVIKVSFDKSSAGHNGVQSIIETLGTGAFSRVRIGIGSNHEGAEYVLDKFSPDEKKALEEKLKNIPKIIEVFVTQGREVVMNTFNM